MFLRQVLLGNSGQLGSRPSINGAGIELHLGAQPSIHGECSVKSLVILGLLSPVLLNLRGVSTMRSFLPLMPLAAASLTEARVLALSVIRLPVLLLVGALPPVQVICSRTFLSLGGVWGVSGTSCGLGVVFYYPNSANKQLSEIAVSKKLFVSEKLGLLFCSGPLM